MQLTLLYISMIAKRKPNIKNIDPLGNQSKITKNIVAK